MKNANVYLQWLSGRTVTSWWHDSADPNEIAAAVANGAVGVTTNPLLIGKRIGSADNPWRELLNDVDPELEDATKAEEIIHRVTVQIAKGFLPVWERTNGRGGCVCAQVNPRFQGDREKMLVMAKRLHDWAPNIAVKLPGTYAGLDTLEECAALGITVTATVSYSVSQALFAAKKYRCGIKRAIASGIKPGKCFAVIMVGRVNDYLMDVANDGKCGVSASDITQAGTAIVKRVREIFDAEQYEAELMPSGMRSADHVTDLAGGNMILSIHPQIQKLLQSVPEPFELRSHIPVAPKIIDSLMRMEEFRRAYEPDGMKPEEFIGYGAVQRTLSQFVDAGWAKIEEYRN